MIASGSQLSQSRPSVTTAQSAFTASLVTEIGLIVVCNTTGTAADCSIYHDDDGSTFDQSTALLYQKSIPANDYLLLDARSFGYITVKPSGQIGIQSGTANALTFTLYGITEEIARG